MSSEYKLPGAEAFSRWLDARTNQSLRVEGPERLASGTSRMWNVYLGDEKIGEYIARDNGEKQYHGRVPGYINDPILESNKIKNEDRRLPVDTILLLFSNVGSEHDYDEKTRFFNGRLVETPWQRQDGHNQVPFP